MDLIDEYWNIYHKLHFKIEDIKQVVLNGFKAAFMSEQEKQGYCDAVEKAWTQWFKEHPDIKS